VLVTDDEIGRAAYRRLTMTYGIQPYRGDYLRPSFRNATVADTMTPGIITCAPETSLEVVAELMATHRVHAIAIGGMAADQLVWGVIDTMDLIRALRDPDAAGCAEAISHQPAPAIDPDAPLSEAVRMMDEHSTAHLVVVDRGRPVGVVSTLDVAGAAAWGRK
jgi:CBS domain-containing protein